VSGGKRKEQKRARKKNKTKVASVRQLNELQRKKNNQAARRIN